MLRLTPFQIKNPLSNLFRVVNQKLGVIHSGENLNVSIGVDFAQVGCLWFGHECLFSTIPEMNVSAVDCLQFMGIDILVAVSYGFSLPIRPNLLTLIQQHIEIVRVKHKFPKTGPVVAGPNVETLVVTQRLKLNA